MASALIPQKLLEQVPDRTLDALVWFERTSDGLFSRHSLASGVPNHAAIELGDFDDDGDIDIVAGCYNETRVADQAAINVFWNEGQIQSP